MNSFDYIVVGGGTAGCVLAARLSQNPGVDVLLLEAGAAQPSPAIADPGAWFSLAGTSVDWGFQTVPQPGTDNAAHRWPRGKVLGGSSGINGMMHVRGDRSSYDAWDAAGATGWNYASLLPFFKRSERAVGGDPAYRGLGGAKPRPTLIWCPPDGGQTSKSLPTHMSRACSSKTPPASVSNTTSTGKPQQHLPTVRSS
jgi:choline dehydrogenase